MQSFDAADFVLVADCCYYGVANRNTISRVMQPRIEQRGLPAFQESVENMGS